MSDIALVGSGLGAGIVLGALIMAIIKRSKGVSSQMRRVKWLARRDWFLDPDNPHRLPSAATGLVLAVLTVGTWLGMYATGLSSLTAASLSCLLSSVLLALAFLFMLFLKEEMSR